MLIHFNVVNAIWIALVFFCGTLAVIGQAQGQDVDRRFEIPSEHISVLLINDPKCPIQLTGPTRVIGWSSGAISLGFNLQNVSKANIESFGIEETDWFGSYGYSIRASMKENFFFVPLMTISPDAWLADRTEDLVAYDEKKISKKILYPANRIWIVMIVNVRLSDGSVYDASKKFDELRRFFDKQFEEFDSGQIDIDEREQKLRSFVDNLTKSKKR